MTREAGTCYYYEEESITDVYIITTGNVGHYNDTLSCPVNLWSTFCSVVWANLPISIKSVQNAVVVEVVVIVVVVVVHCNSAVFMQKHN